MFTLGDPPLHRGGDVFTATTPSPNMTDGAARTSCRSSQIMVDQGPADAALCIFPPLFLFPLLSLVCFSAPLQVQSNQQSSRIAAQRAANRGVAGLQLPKMDSYSESAQELPLEPPSGSRPECRIFTFQFFLELLSQNQERENLIPPHHHYWLPTSCKVPCSRCKNSFPSDSDRKSVV